MKWMQMFLLGYVLVLGGVAAALWKLGVLQHVDPVWLAIGSVIAIGIGVMISVATGGPRETVEIDKH